MKQPKQRIFWAVEIVNGLMDGGMGMSQTDRKSLERQFESEPATLTKAACHMH
jgi:hypothetical protein